MNRGRFEISKGPSNRGGLDLGLFSKSNQPSRRGGLDLGPAGPPEALPLAERGRCPTVWTAWLPVYVLTAC